MAGSGEEDNGTRRFDSKVDMGEMSERGDRDPWKKKGRKQDDRQAKGEDAMTSSGASLSTNELLTVCVFLISSQNCPSFDDGHGQGS